MHKLLTLLVVLASTGVAAAAHPVTVYLDRDGEVQPSQDGEDAVTIPKFGGGDRTWNAVVSCVRKQYAPFAIEFVEQRPANGPYITAVVGGWASSLGLDDRSTNGVGPYDGTVIPNAVVHIFSKVGTGEHDVENLCAVTAHEVAHSLGLDHEYYCGDVMSYYLDQCGTRKFIDVDAPCGDDGPRACGNGDETQNSYQRLGKNLGWRDGSVEARRPTVDRTPDDGDDGDVAPTNKRPRDPWGDDDDAPPANNAPATDDGAQPQDPYSADDDADEAPAQVQYDEIRTTTKKVQRGAHTYVIRVHWIRHRYHRR